MKEVLKHYSLGELKKIEQIKSGLMNATFKIDTSKGKFILQEIRDKHMAHDHDSLERYLGDKSPDIKIPTQLKTNKGEVYVENEGRNYRVMEYIESQNINSLTPELCYNLGEALANFHLQTKGFNEKLEYSIPDFHNTPKIIDKLEKIKNENMGTKKWELVSSYYNKIRDDVQTLLRVTPLQNLPSRLIHGDPKWQNFLYEDGKVNAIIDLETLMYGHELTDIGDALRSWSKDEDYNFIMENYKSALAGYFSKNQNFISRHNPNGSGLPTIDMIPNSMALITLELSARFLIDYFEQSYFGNRKTNWDSEENFRRLERQMKFYEDMKSKLDLSISGEELFTEVSHKNFAEGWFS